MIQDVSIDAHVVHELGHVGALPGEHYFSGAWSTPVMAVRISSHARTASQARASSTNHSSQTPLCPKMGFPCISQDQGALDGAKHISLSAPWLVANAGPVGRAVKDSVQAEASGKCDRRALRMHGKLVLPNMLTRSRPAATRGSRVPLATTGSMVPPPRTQGVASTWQTDAHWCMCKRLGAEFDLVLVHELLGVSRTQQFAHLDGPRLAAVVFLCCQRSRVSEPADSLLKRAAKAT